MIEFGTGLRKLQ
jgi:hypothetical protein